MNLAERLEVAIAEAKALATYRKRPGNIIGHCRNWPRILDWHGTAPRNRRKYKTGKS